MNFSISLYFGFCIAFVLGRTIAGNCTCEPTVSPREVALQLLSGEAYRHVALNVNIRDCTVKLNRLIRPDAVGTRHSSLQACCCKAVWRYRRQDGVADLLRCETVACTM